MPSNLHRIHEDRVLSNKDMLNGGHSISDYSRRFGSNSSFYDRIRDPYNRPYTRPFPTGRGLWRPEQHKMHSKTNGQDNSNPSKMDKHNYRSQDDIDSAASLDSTGKRKSFRRLCQRFAEKTSMQGIPYINSAKLIIAKVIWTILLLGAVGGMFFHLVFLFENYLEFSKSTKIELSFENLQFPDITICNTNIIKLSSLRYLNHSSELVTLIRAVRPENVAPDMFGAPDSGDMGSTQGQSKTTRNMGPTQGQNRTTTASVATEQNRTTTESVATEPVRTNPPLINDTNPRTGTRRPPPTTVSNQTPPPPPQQRKRRQINQNQPSGPQTNLRQHPMQNVNLTGYRLDLLDYLDDLAADDDEYDSPLDTQSKIYNLFTSYYMDLPKKKREQIGHQLSEMLIACRFNQRVCDHTQFSLHQSSEYGNCWTIHSRRQKMVVRDAGPSGGLEMVLYLQTNEFLKGLTNGYGIRMTLQRPQTYPFPYDQGIFVPAAMETSIGLKMKSIHRTIAPHGECDPDLEKQFETLFETQYTRQACQATCLVVKLFEECDCFLDGTEEIAIKKLATAHPCRSRKEEKCMVKLMRMYERKEVTCSCPNPCHELEYVQSISQRQWPTDDYAMVLLDSACDLDDAACDVLRQHDNRKLSYNFLKLNIYYQDLNFENITEEPEIATSQFLSDVGGALGLWIGLSILSICELGQLIVELIDYFIHKSRNSSEREERRREKRRREKEQNYNSKPTKTNDSKVHLSVPSAKYEMDNRSGRNTPRNSPRPERRYRDASPRPSPHDSPRNSPWNERRMRDDIGMSPPLRYYNEY